MLMRAGGRLHIETARLSSATFDPSGAGGPVPAVGAAEAGAADFHPDLVAIQSDVDASLPPRPASPEY
jgi:hypothetical protein